MGAPRTPQGVLLVNLGTPDAPEPRAVRRYLREFLSDPRVLDMPAPARAALLYGVILPLRPRRAAAAYRKIWLPEGSPLRVHGCALRDALAKELPDAVGVELAMRYGRPSIRDALARLVEADAAQVIVVPLFPQSAAASTGSALACVYAEAARLGDTPPLAVLPAFYDDPGFVAATAAVARPALERFAPDFVLMSYHGLPERQVKRSDRSGNCLAAEDCCDTIGPRNRGCYRAQCFATSRALAEALGLEPARTATAFQSRLGRSPWLKPYTDLLLPDLFERGVRRLAVLCPTFVADCLETLEEIGIRARAQWREAGGEDLCLVPSLNAHPRWVEALAARIRAIG